MSSYDRQYKRQDVKVAPPQIHTRTYNTVTEAER